jgi:hypothetical protein
MFEEPVLFELSSHQSLLDCTSRFPCVGAVREFTLKSECMNV